MKAGNWKFVNKETGEGCFIQVNDATDSKVREAFTKAVEILDPADEKSVLGYDITGRQVQYNGLTAQKQQKNETKETTEKPKRTRKAK